MNYNKNCSLKCGGHEIILDEKMMEVTLLLEYSATVIYVFKWRSHTGPCGVGPRLKITPPVTRCSSSCQVSVDNSEVDQGPFTKTHLNLIHATSAPRTVHLGNHTNNHGTGDYYCVKVCCGRRELIQVQQVAGVVMTTTMICTMCLRLENPKNNHGLGGYIACIVSSVL